MLPNSDEARSDASESEMTFNAYCEDGYKNEKRVSSGRTDPLETVIHPQVPWIQNKIRRCKLWQGS